MIWKLVVFNLYFGYGQGTAPLIEVPYDTQEECLEAGKEAVGNRKNIGFECVRARSVK